MGFYSIYVWIDFSWWILFNCTIFEIKGFYMNNWDKFMDWWDYNGRVYVARTIMILVFLLVFFGTIILMLMPNPFSWGVFLTRLGITLGVILLMLAVVWAWNNLE
jgi:hypothetical protein